LRPKELFHGSASGVVVKDGRAFIKSTSVWGAAEAKLLAIEMMAELVAKGAQE
jgi:deoxyribose-phosphate aldolase